MHQHIKNTPGKPTNILLTPSLKILTHRGEIKTLRTKAQWGLALGCAHALSQQNLYFPLNSKGSHKICNQGNSGRQQLSLSRELHASRLCSLLP